MPVVLMGETGCGKTHLIRYMCKFAAYKKPVQNMFILKVRIILLKMYTVTVFNVIGTWWNNRKRCH